MIICVNIFDLNFQPLKLYLAKCWHNIKPTTPVLITRSHLFFYELKLP